MCSPVTKEGLYAHKTKTKRLYYADKLLIDLIK
jgi:hypothetical protein